MRDEDCISGSERGEEGEEEGAKECAEERRRRQRRRVPVTVGKSFLVVLLVAPLEQSPLFVLAVGWRSSRLCCAGSFGRCARRPAVALACVVALHQGHGRKM
jgi:hypothetical protein